MVIDDYLGQTLSRSAGLPGGIPIGGQGVEPVRGLVQHVRIEVGVVGPDDGAGLRINADLGEEGWVFVGSEHAAAIAYARGEVDDAAGAVGEGTSRT